MGLCRSDASTAASSNYDAGSIGAAGREAAPSVYGNYPGNAASSTAAGNNYDAGNAG